MTILYLDVESIGLNGPCMRIQYAVDDGPIIFIDRERHTGRIPRVGMLFLCRILYNPETLLLAYNAAFDLYHLYRAFEEMDKNVMVKPFACRVLDLQVPAMLNGPFKNFAFSRGKARSVARVRRIPLVSVPVVRKAVLEKLRPLVPAIFDIQVGEHECKGQPHLRTLSFSVDGRATLKAHARHYGAETLSLADNWPLPEKVDGKNPEKLWLQDWRKQGELYEPLIEKAFGILATPDHPFEKYCRLDIWFLRLLYEALGRPEPDHHSDCVHAVAYTRYHGFEVDHTCLAKTREFYKEKVDASEKALVGTNLKSSKQRLTLLRSVDPLVASSSRKVLEVLAGSERPSARIAGSMLDCGKYRQRLLQVEKVLESGRAYPSLRVMGTSTGRMAGTDGLNWQGIAQAEYGLGIRAAMKCGSGGDFESLEVGIAAAAYHDEQLQADLDAGIDPHSMVASMLPESVRAGTTYEQIRDGYKAENKAMTGLRKKGKATLFATIYGAQFVKVAQTIGGTESEAKTFLERIFNRYKGIGRFRAKAEKQFCTADTSNWSRDSVRKMSRSVTDLLGFTRQFDFECGVAGVLWELGSTTLTGLPQGCVVRTKEKGQQTIPNAVKSAFLGGALAIQQAIWRQACNSPVQSTGANLTKILMARLWNRLRVPILNIHDELISPAPVSAEMTQITNEFLTEFRGIVPSLNIEMKEIKRWSEK